MGHDRERSGRLLIRPARWAESAPAYLLDGLILSKAPKRSQTVHDSRRGGRSAPRLCQPAPIQPPLPNHRRFNLPYADAASNAIWIQVVLLAMDLTTWAQQLALTGTWRVAQPKTLRLKLFATAARYVTTARRRIVDIDQPGPWHQSSTTLSSTSHGSPDSHPPDRRTPHDRPRPEPRRPPPRPTGRTPTPPNDKPQ